MFPVLASTDKWTNFAAHLMTLPGSSIYKSYKYVESYLMSCRRLSSLPMVRKFQVDTVAIIVSQLFADSLY